MQAAGTEAAPAAGRPHRPPRTIRVPWAVRQAEGVAYWLVVAPFLALLPSAIAYRAACWRADWAYLSCPEKRDEVANNLRRVLGAELSDHEAERMTRDIFRMRTCIVIDVMRMRGKGRALRKLVEIRGLEHLDAALAGGKGAILCTPHLGSYLCAFSLIQRRGYPVTTIGRWWWHYPPGASSIVTRMWDLVYGKRVLRHRQRPNIEPYPGRFQSAVQAANILRDNEVVTICSDAPPLAAELPRTIEVPFLSARARLVPGVVYLAQATGAPVLMTTIHRLPDYRHQVLEISPPMPMDGDPATVLARCAAAMDAAIRANPTEWDMWYKLDDLVGFGLVPGDPRPEADAGDRTELAAPVAGAN